MNQPPIDNAFVAEGCEQFTMHAETMKAGQTKWLLQWHEARKVTLVKPIPHTGAWDSVDEFGNQHIGHAVSFYDSAFECWSQALENSRDSVNYATCQREKHRP